MAGEEAVKIRQWRSGLVSCAPDMPCQKKIKELEKKIRTETFIRMRATIEECELNHKEGWNAALEEAAKAVDPWVLSEWQTGIGSFINFKSLEERIRELKK